MPADARSLLRAASSSSAAAPRIHDAHASYHPRSGALRCSACAYAAVKHEALWAAHVASKSHRGNVARIRAEQEQQARAQQQQSAEASASGTKRAADAAGDEAGDEARKRPRAEPEADEAPAAAVPDEAAEEDPEWAAFEAEVLNAPEAAEAAAPRYIDSTTEVAPQLRRPGGGIAPVVQEEQPEPEIKETEEERRERLEREEKEEIFGRLMEEQREQEEVEER
ncbi:hypothetical protein FA09DRAFT_329470 [Tilletiopsis washingtonensis]|jgi:zinc finger protein 830|uniref:Coiled-coil domain-containing protein 16 n=1 Tax=Tilletiopsis washingtonensis TaxID=58919 RepID=A0A316ZBU7_9BASI|nr:hypothetical protein FA09DRAFT_329470 [Tilletiopsis washingtonensis]PWN98412.1 hypothetical protein FA09DRAFT_329470 [Tilletiopsis washingtonensis]